jgi:hypothetical protein
VFAKPSLRPDDRGEDSYRVGAGRRHVLLVQLAEAFLLTEAVELGGDDYGGGLVGGACELKWRSRISEPSEYPARIVVGAGDPYACRRSGSPLACPPCPIRVSCLGSRREAGGTRETGGSCIQRDRRRACTGQQASAIGLPDPFGACADQLTCGFSPA